MFVLDWHGGAELDGPQSRAMLGQSRAKLRRRALETAEFGWKPGYR
jgi:hypothetical protein